MPKMGLVLQGGGALGAYEYGAVTRLVELGWHPVAVTGVSIGAATAAAVAGAPDADICKSLKRLWEAITLDSVPFWPPERQTTFLSNNLVFWRNRYGHANRDHRALLEAASNPKLSRDLERLLFGLYRGNAAEAGTFDRLSEITGAKYPLLAYLYFLKDVDRFMPIQPTGFDRAFNAIGINFSTLRQCSWENYSTYNQTIAALRPLIMTSAGLKTVRLIDAHSFCWIFSSLLKLEAEGSIAKALGAKDAGRVLGGCEKSIIAMRLSVENTVKNANGQIVQRILKNKELRMTSAELERLIGSLLDLQDNRCALTGIPFQFHGPDTDKNLLPSIDRIDSDGEVGNLQVVCQFINFWKGDSDNAEFQRPSPMYFATKPPKRPTVSATHFW
jgi:hypothetical protein